jgi:hypothetical protein
MSQLKKDLYDIVYTVLQVSSKHQVSEESM